jgi:hypothetical protein
MDFRQVVRVYADLQLQYPNSWQNTATFKLNYGLPHKIASTKRTSAGYSIGIGLLFAAALIRA